MIKRVCLQCGKTFETYPSVIKKGGGKFCSVGCGTTYRNLHNNPAKDPQARLKISQNHADVTGEKNPMFGKRGSQAPSYVDGRNSFKGETYKRILLASGAEKKCVCCGKTKGLQIHHVNGNHKDNRLSNLVWICTKCHNTKAHTYLRDKRGRFVGSVLNTRLNYE